MTGSMTWLFSISNRCGDVYIGAWRSVRWLHTYVNSSFCNFKLLCSPIWHLHSNLHQNNTEQWSIHLHWCPVLLVVAAGYIHCRELVHDGIENTCYWYICGCTFYCTVGPLECSVALQATAMTDTSITVMLMWTNCEGAESSTVSLSCFPVHNSCNVRYTSSLPVNYEITDLVSSTNYSIMASFSDGCGSMSAMIVAATLPSTSKFSAHFS